jgi:hypothetical protein
MCRWCADHVTFFGGAKLVEAYAAECEAKAKLLIEEQSVRIAT